MTYRPQVSLRPSPGLVDGFWQFLVRGNSVIAINSILKLCRFGDRKGTYNNLKSLIAIILDS